MPTDAGVTWTAMAPAAPSAPAQPSRPPTQPQQWLTRDVAVARIVVVARDLPTAALGAERCRCGAWRYTLDETAGLPLWRCLHCGDLHAGDDPIPQA